MFYFECAKPTLAKKYDLEEIMILRELVFIGPGCLERDVIDFANGTGQFIVLKYDENDAVNVELEVKAQQDSSCSQEVCATVIPYLNYLENCGQCIIQCTDLT